MVKASLLIVEDDASQSAILSMDLKRRGFQVEAVKSGEDAIQKMQEQDYDVVIADLKLSGGMDGLTVLKKTKEFLPDTEVVMVTGHGTIHNAVEAMKGGAYDYLTKPFETDELAVILEKALERRKLLGEVRRLREEVKGKYSFEGIIYVSREMQNVLDLVRKVAATDAVVLIHGESGTGKELIARALHENSPRRNGSFVAINCGAIPEGLLESELFGHVKGSFTGADRNKRGLFEEANGGTIFLDEISETTPGLQVKLLRVLQEHEIRRVGDNHPIKVSGRVITATNKDLAHLSKEGKFREDLYYRLKVFPIHLPPLRDRPDDIMPLAEHFLRRARKKNGGEAGRFSVEAAAALRAYSWPGNVRELEHTVERALIMASGPAIRAEDLPSEIQAPPGARRRSKSATLEDTEKDHILDTLKACGGNQNEAAKKLGIGRNTLWRKLKAYGIPKQA